MSKARGPYRVDPLAYKKSQKALDKMAENARELGLDYEPAQQEPVAYMGTDIEGSPNKFRLNPFGGCVPLYKKPQSVKVWDAEGYGALCQELEGWKAKAQRKPLTDEEWQSIADTLDCFITRGQKDAIEAALGIKENT